MNKNLKIAIICIVLSIIIGIIPLATIKGTDFGGSDGQAEEAIAEIDNTYEPWFSSIMEPPGGETESLLFCLQAALGAGAFGYGMGYLVSRKKYSKKDNDDTDR